MPVYCYYCDYYCYCYCYLYKSYDCFSTGIVLTLYLHYLFFPIVFVFVYLFVGIKFISDGFSPAFRSTVSSLLWYTLSHQSFPSSIASDTTAATFPSL